MLSWRPMGLRTETLCYLGREEGLGQGIRGSGDTCTTSEPCCSELWVCKMDKLPLLVTVMENHLEGTLRA